MLNIDENGLRIFDNFEVDTNLPKHGLKGPVEVQMRSGVNNVFISPTARRADGSITRVDAEGNAIGVNNQPMQVIATNKDSFKEWFGRFLSRIGDKLLGKDKYKEKYVVESTPDAPKISVEEFFKHIKNSKRQMEKIDNRIEAYEAALKQAEEFGQVALKEQLEKKIDVVRAESQLYAKNMVKVVLEEQVVQFYKESDRAIRLDWIKNFTRTIPEKILDKKKELDEVKVFDNYVIMHYDPDGTAYKMTQKEEEEARKDPILFGVIEGSRKLYYVGDWIDNYCDLTLDDFIDKFGKEAIKKNNITTNIDI